MNHDSNKVIIDLPEGKFSQTDLARVHGVSMMMQSSLHTALVPNH